MYRSIQYSHEVVLSNKVLHVPIPLDNLTNRNFFTHIFIVPFGPRFVFSTLCNPKAALVLSCKAAAARANSALGFNV